MTLQEILLKLSNNKEVAAECTCNDGHCMIVIKEWYTFKELAKVFIDLNHPIEKSIVLTLTPYFYVGANENPPCEHRSTSSWGRLVSCLDCGKEWIEGDR